MVRLGAGGLDGRRSTPEAMQAALQVSSKFRRLAESHTVDEIVAVATSAVREAENGGEFLQDRRRGDRHSAAGHLRHRGSAPHSHGGGLRRRRAPARSLVVIDIGGGSVEITRGAGPTMESGRSFKLGVIRLTERFVKSDPISPREERKLVRHIDADVGEHIERIKRAGFDRVVGTSGTILSLGAIAAGHHSRGGVATLRNRRVSAKQLHRVRRTMTSIGLEKRVRVPGLEPRRADLSPAGAVLLDTLVRRLGADGTHALRPVAARRRRPRLHRAAPEGNRAGRSVSRRPPAQHHRARRAVQLLAGARTADCEAVDGAVRSDAGDPWPDRQGTRVAGIRGDPARHRRAYQLRTPPQALRVPDPQRRPARVRARRDRNHRAGRPLSSARHAQEAARRAARVPRPAPPRDPDAGGDPEAGGKPRSQPRADHQRRRAARPGRGRPAAAADQERRRARAVGGQPARRPVRAPPQEAPSSRSEQDRPVC